MSTGSGCHRFPFSSLKYLSLNGRSSYTFSSNMNPQHNLIVKRVIDDLIGRYKDNIIAIYGIGSYFDDSIPPNWVKEDLDIVIFVKSLEKIPKQNWTDIPYKKKQIDGHQVWITVDNDYNPV